jgi:predicted ATPase
MPHRQVLCPTLIGRHDELQAIDAALARACGGRGSSIVLSGEAGVGKSRLAQETAARAEQRRMRVLQGRCVQGGESSPYRPFAEALLAGLRGQTLPDVPELRPYKSILARLIPDWRAETAATMEQSIVLLGEAILRLLLVLGGEHGCLLVIEDLHWADAETLALVEYVGSTCQCNLSCCSARCARTSLRPPTRWPPAGS